MTTSNIMTVRELIHLAFGDKHLSVLKRQVEVTIDPELIASLIKTPSNLSVTEVKIHAAVPEELEANLYANDNVRTSESVAPTTGKSESSFVDRESGKLKRDHRNVSYGGVRSKLIDSGASNSLENEPSASNKKPTQKVQQEKYLVVDRRKSEDVEPTVKKKSKRESGTGSPPDKYKLISVVTKDQYKELLSEIQALKRASADESNRLPETKALLKELKKVDSVTHPMSAMILSDRLEQSEKKLKQMVSALQRFMQRDGYETKQHVDNDTATVNTDNSSPKKVRDKNITVSRASEIRRQNVDENERYKEQLPKSSSEISKSLIDENDSESFTSPGQNPIKDYEFDETYISSPDLEFSAGACKDSPSLISIHDENGKLIQLSNVSQLLDTAITNECEASAQFESFTTKAANNETEDFLTINKEIEKYNMKQRLLIKDEYIATHFPDIVIPNTRPHVMEKKKRKMTKIRMFASEVDQSNETEKDEVFVVFDIPNIQGSKPTRRMKNNEGNQNLVPLKPDESVLPDFTDITMKEIKEEDAILQNDMKKLSITEVDQKDSLVAKIYTLNHHETHEFEIKTKDNHLKEEKEDQNKLTFNKQASLNFFDEDGNLISQAEVDNYYEKVYDFDGNKISRFKDKQGKIIPWAEIENYNELYDEYGNMGEYKVKPKQTSKNALLKVHSRDGKVNVQAYDNLGKPILTSIVDAADQIFDKKGNLIQRVFDRDGKPIAWSQMSFVDKTYDKNGKLISHPYDHNGSRIPWSDVNNTKTVYNNSGNITAKDDKHGNPQPRSKVDESGKFYDENGDQISQILDTDEYSIPKPTKNYSDNSEYKNEKRSEINPIHAFKEDDFPEVYYDEHKKQIPRNAIVRPNTDADKVNDVIVNLIPQVNKDKNLTQHSNIDKPDKFDYNSENSHNKHGNAVPLSKIYETNKLYDKTDQQVTKIDENKTKSILLMQKVSYEEHLINASNKYDFLDENKKQIPLHSNKWSSKQGKLNEKYDNDLDKRKLQGGSFDYRRSQLISSSLFEDMSRSFSLPKKSSAEPENFKSLDWVIRSEFQLGMLTLREDIEKQVIALFGQTNQTAKHSSHKLTEIQDQLNSPLAVGSRMPAIENQIAQFTQRITEMELFMVQKMTEYQDEIAQHQIQLETVLENMAESIANIAGDPQGIEDLNTDLTISKNDLDMLSLSQRGLQDMLRNIKLDLRELRTLVNTVRSVKADNTEISEAFKCKATIADLNQVVSREEFIGVMSELAVDIAKAFDKFNNQEYSWQTQIEELAKCMNKKTNIKSLEAVCKDIISNTKKLCEKKEYLLRIVGEPKSEYIHKHIGRDDTCLCCHTAVIMIETQEPNDDGVMETHLNKSAVEAGKKKGRGKVYKERVFCYPGLPPNHELDSK